MQNYEPNLPNQQKWRKEIRRQFLYEPTPIRKNCKCYEPKLPNWTGRRQFTSFDVLASNGNGSSSSSPRSSYSSSSPSNSSSSESPSSSPSASNSSDNVIKAHFYRPLKHIKVFIFGQWFLGMVDSGSMGSFSILIRIGDAKVHVPFDMVKGLPLDMIIGQNVMDALHADQCRQNNDELTYVYKGQRHSVQLLENVHATQKEKKTWREQILQ
ncbi:hypothetical protein niasHT_032352 [Heterodera trifolii]|uniref:Uncharacterized protein n=1 Tax=Heterodera trifolii TaxID=157864 RepID=A0ABD2HYG2_9BILA